MQEAERSETAALPSDELVERADQWIAAYWNAEHLRRTRDWLLELEPQADEALVLAALTHDMERHFPGGPEADLGRPPDDREYRRLHSERAAHIVGDWLRKEEAPRDLVDAVQELIRLHETGGSRDADLLQAADSLSFLEVNAGLVAGWVADGLCSRERGREQHRWMFERIRIDRARELGRPLLERALARL